MAMQLQSKRKIPQLGPRALVGLLLALIVVGAYAWYAQRPTGNEATRAVDSASAVVNEVAETDAPLVSIEPQAPIRLKINSIAVDAPIIPVGTEPDGAMAAPQTATDIGWYEKSATVGSAKRAMLLSGHYGLDTPEVLRRLNELKTGDTISVQGAEGGSATYRVVETERQHRNDVDMEKAFNYGEGEEAVSIITCIGEFDYSADTYTDRHIVYALRIK